MTANIAADLQAFAVPIDVVHEDPRNANTHNERSQRAIRASGHHLGRAEGTAWDFIDDAIAALEAAKTVSRG